MGVETASEASCSSGEDLAEAPEDFLRVFRSGLANWSAELANVSSPELLEAEDKESEAPFPLLLLPLGRGLGLIAGAVEAGKSSTKSGVCFCFC